MAFSLQQHQVKSQDAGFYDRNFRTTIESCLDLLIQHPQTRRLGVESKDVFKYEGDLYSLLELYHVPLDHRWIVLRMNGMHNPNEFGTHPDASGVTAHGVTLLIPDEEYVNTLFMQHRQVFKKNSPTQK